jgi:membrane protein implicated in regulation of membrane protease activity
MRIRSQRENARGTVGHAYSALNLRLLLAWFGLVSCAALAVVSARVGPPALAVVLTVLAVVAAVDLIVVQRRRTARRREEPDVRHSLFE